MKKQPTKKYDLFYLHNINCERQKKWVAKMFNCKAISFNRMQICLAKSNHTIETNGKKICYFH